MSVAVWLIGFWPLYEPAKHRHLQLQSLWVSKPPNTKSWPAAWSSKMANSLGCPNILKPKPMLVLVGQRDLCTSASSPWRVTSILLSLILLPFRPFLGHSFAVTGSNRNNASFAHLPRAWLVYASISDGSPVYQSTPGLAVPTHNRDTSYHHYPVSLWWKWWMQLMNVMRRMLPRKCGLLSVAAEKAW